MGMRDQPPSWGGTTLSTDMVEGNAPVEKRFITHLRIKQWPVAGDQ